jgi:multiple sugar transport system substrate-binding protein
MRSRIAVAVVLLLVSLMAGCARRPQASPRRVRVTCWSGFVGVDQDIFKKLVAMFNAEQERYRLEKHTTVEEDTRIFRSITAGTPPDFFFLWQPAYIGALAANGALMPLDGFLRRSGLRREDFVPGALDQARYRGKLYALPFLMDGSGLFWNRDVFAQAGLAPDGPPRTVEELLDCALKLTKRDARGNLARLGFQPPALHEMIGLFGGRLADPASGRWTTASPRSPIRAGIRSAKAPVSWAATSP